MAHEVDSLIALQRASFEAFTQPDVAPHERGYEGLDGCLRALFPLDDFNRTAELDYGGYRFGDVGASTPARWCARSRRRVSRRCPSTTKTPKARASPPT